MLSPRLPWQTALFPRQRVQSPRQALPRLPRKTVLFPRLPRQITLFLRQRVQSSKQAFLRQPWWSGTQQGLGPHRFPLITAPRQAILLGQIMVSHSQRVWLCRWYLPRPVLHRKQGLPPLPIGKTVPRVLPPLKNLTQSG